MRVSRVPCWSLLLAVASSSAWAQPQMPEASGSSPIEQPTPQPAAMPLPDDLAALEQLRTELHAEFLRLRESDPVGALRAVERCVAIDRKAIQHITNTSPNDLGLLNSRRNRLISTAAFAASAREEAGDFDAAIALRAEIADVLAARWGADHWRTKEARGLCDDVAGRKNLTLEQRDQLTAARRLEDEVRRAINSGKATGSALAQAEEVIDIRRDVLGEQHRTFASSVHLLGWLNFMRGDADRAEPMLRQALEIRKAVLGEQHPDYATSLNDLGWLYYSMGASDRAEPLYQQALQIRLAAFGEQHADYAQCLANLALLYERRKDFSRAEPLYRALADIRKTTLGERHPCYATILNNLANTYYWMQDYARAEPLYKQVLEIREAALPAQHTDYVTSLNNLANVYNALQDFTQAEPLYRRVLEIRKATLSEQHADYIISLNNLATVYKAMSDYNRALPLYEKAVQIRKETVGQDHLEYAASINSLGVICDAMGDHLRAEALCLLELEVRRKLQGEQHPAYATALNNLGSAYRKLGNVSRAEQLLQQAKGIRLSVLGEQHPDYADSLNSLAMLYTETGDYARAEPLFRQALAVRKAAFGEHHQSYATALDNLATLLAEIGDFAGAEEASRQALLIRKTVLGERHRDYINSLNNLGLLYWTRGDYNRAEPLLVQALERVKETYGDQHDNYASGLNNLALLYEGKRDFARAEALSQQALQLKRALHGERHKDLAVQLQNLATLYARLGEYGRAEPFARQGMEILKDVVGDQHPAYAMSLSNLSCVYFYMGDNERAEPLSRQALEITGQTLAATAVVLSEGQQLAMARKNRTYLDLYLNCLVELGGRDAEAFRAVLGWKGTTLMRQRAARLCADAPELEVLFTELQSVTRQWSTLVQTPPPPEQAERRREQLAALSTRKHDLESQLSRQSPVYRDAHRSVSVEELQASLPADSALVDYLEFGRLMPDPEHPGLFGTQRCLLAFVVRPEGLPQLFDLGPVSPIGAAVENWRSTYGADAPGRQAGETLRRIVWEPLQAALGDASLILVSPDGVIGRVPLAALPGRRTGSYLLEDHRLAVVTVPQLIPALVALESRSREREPARPRALAHDLLLMGGIDYDHRPEQLAWSTVPVSKKRHSRFESDTRAITDGAVWTPLVDSAAEVAFIKDLYQQLYETTGEAIVDRRDALATEEAFRELAPRCRLIHLATHGFFAQPKKTSALASAAESAGGARALGGTLTDEQYRSVRGYSPGLLSGLVLAGANSPPELPEDPAQLDQLPDDGILTAEEIAFLPLNGVRLVVLSACETGLGEVAGGEGVLGLQRAFQVAGAERTVTTLWQVNDLATRRLMEEFYRGYLGKELPAADALRNAQLWLLRNPDQLRGDQRIRPQTATEPERSPPYFWAAFQFSGDWR